MRTASATARDEQTKDKAEDGSRGEHVVGVLMHYPIGRPGALPDFFQCAIAEVFGLRAGLASLFVGVWFFHNLVSAATSCPLSNSATIGSLPHGNPQGLAPANFCFAEMR